MLFRSLFDDTVSAIIPGGSAFGPAAVDIGEGEAPDEVAKKRIAAVGNSIGLHEAGLRDIPVIGADGDLVS